MSEPERMAVEHLIRDLQEFAAESGPHGRYPLDVNDAWAILDAIHAGQTNGATCLRLTRERNEALVGCKQTARERDEALEDLALANVALERHNATITRLWALAASIAAEHSHGDDMWHSTDVRLIHGDLLDALNGGESDAD